MEKHTGQGIIEYFDRFKTDLDCLSYLATIKWEKGFGCSKCKHTKFTIRKSNLARDCNRCHHIESPTAGTMFHKVKFGIRKAFTIVFEMSATTKSISSSQMAKRLNIRSTTAWLFMHKVRISMKSSERFPITGTVIVDEFVFGGKEDLKPGRSSNTKKKKIVAAVEINEKGGVKRAYSKSIPDYSSSSLETIFDAHISTDAKVETDKWSGYMPLKKTYTINQTKSNKGSTFFEMNTIVHQTKSWLRSTFSWMHEGHIEKYLDEYSYRLNRSQNKDTIFDNLINRVVNAKHLSYRDIIISN